VCRRTPFWVVAARGSGGLGSPRLPCRDPTPRRIERHLYALERPAPAEHLAQLQVLLNADEDVVAVQAQGVSLLGSRALERPVIVLMAENIVKGLEGGIS